MIAMKRIALIALGLVSASARAQTTPPAKPSLFTEAQAARGAAVYEKVCIECHEKLEYTGSDFRTKWNNKPVFDLFDLLRATMPDENPGTLSNQEYIDIVGYMMKLNGVPAGATALPTDVAMLKKIKIEIPGGGASRAASGKAGK
jgi:mono/diheme cytochrome c family protein